MVLMMEFTKEIIARLKIFYNEDEQKSWKMFKMQKFWGEIWYMLTLLVIIFDRKIALMQGLRHRKEELSNSILYVHFDNRARNGGCLKFASQKQNDESSPESYDLPPTADIHIWLVFFHYFSGFIYFSFIILLEIGYFWGDCSPSNLNINNH